MEISYQDLHSDIVQECKLGSRQAQFQLYNLYSKAMYNICLRMMNNEGDAQDLLQDAFIEAFTKIDSFKQESTFGAWIKRIVINKCINALKKRRVQLDYTSELPETESEIIDETDMGYTVEKVNKAIQELPDGYRVIASLYLLEGYDHREISEIMGITESTSKTQFHRAKKKLLEKINRYA